MSKRIPLILIVCFLLFEARVIYVFPNRQAFAMAITGDSKCSFSRTMESQASVRRIRAVTEQMAHATRLIRQEDGFQLWDTPRGRYWMNADVPVLPPQFALVLSEQENRIYGEGEHFVHTGDVVLDCGADYGTFTRSALNAGASLVVAIELAPGKDICLRRTFEQEIRTGHVIVVPKGVWNKPDFLRLYRDSVVQHKTADGPVVPLVTIDQIVKDLKLPRVDFIKMDIEGAEKQALEGGHETISKYHPRMAIATEHLPDDPEKIPQVIRSIAPEYKTACGPCEYADGHIRPQVLYFY
ncbi:MAG TPA: FkbM family methyltransferase [Bryobacteraceae bacterium]|nr:FkbM family methyltransferase [Bryobacteraceae bacterium]